MAQFASDAFTNAAGTALPTHDAAWALHASYTGSAVITDVNSARTNTAGGTGAVYYHSGAPAGADYTVTADLLFKDASGGNGIAGVVGRVDTAANTMYMARYSGLTSDAWQLYKFVAGTATLLGSAAVAITDETSHNVKLEMIGTAIKLYQDGGGTATVSVTDTAITAAGKSGIFVYNSANANNASGIQVDTFSADDVAGGPNLIVAADSLTPSFTESLALLSASAITDTLTPSATESVGLAVLVSATDTVTPGVTETANVVVDSIFAVSASDTLTPTLVEAQSSLVRSALAEAFTLSLGEAQGSLLSSAVTDIATISVTDTAAVLVALVGSDTYIVSITDSAAVVIADTIAKAVTESFTLSLTEVASIVTASLWTDKAVAITVWTDKPDASTTWTVQ